MTKPKISKGTKKLLERLIFHLERLIEESNKSFCEYKYENHLGEAAHKLRKLLVDRKPLLLELMKLFEYERVFKDNFGNLNSTLFTFLQDIRCINRDHGVEYDNRKLIKYLADKFGSHEDWTIDEELEKILNNEDMMSCGGSPFYYNVMRGIVNRVLEEATYFLLHLHKTKELEKLDVEYTYRQILSLGTEYPDAMDLTLEKRHEQDIVKSLKPFRLVEIYDIEYLKGRAHLFDINIPNITPKKQIKENGYMKHYLCD